VEGRSYDRRDRHPDSKLGEEITELVRDTESELLFNHSGRVCCFGALTGLRRGLRFDRELLYAGAMFHGMGLTRRHSSQAESFEVDGANAAHDFPKAHEIAQSNIDLVWTAIALHTTSGIPVHMHPVSPSAAKTTPLIINPFIGPIPGNRSFRAKRGTTIAQGRWRLALPASRRAGTERQAETARCPAGALSDHCLLASAVAA
jgi:hypothetical protein